MERSKHRQADEDYFRNKKSLNVLEYVSGNRGAWHEHSFSKYDRRLRLVASEVLQQLIQLCSGLRATGDVRRWQKQENEPSTNADEERSEDNATSTVNPRRHKVFVR